MINTSTTKHFFAVDLGATSGRTILGTLQDGKLTMEEISRFKHGIVRMCGHYYWDIYHLYKEVISGLKVVAQKGIVPDSIGIDTWGVDFVLVGKDGQILRTPYSYRDPHTNDALEYYFQMVPKERVYEISGIQFMNFNSLFQLAAMKKHADSALSIADKILFLPDALSYLLTGKMVTERTILSTSAFMDARTGKVSNELLSPLGLSDQYFAPIVQPGHLIGTLSQEVQLLTGLGSVPVVAVAGHDTGSAVAAVPATEDGFAYLSSGTWSLMGIEIQAPVINQDSYAKNFTNEGGIDNTTRLLKNICGMWILERCREEWQDAPKSYDTLYEETQKVAPFRSFIFPDAPEFANPVSMVEAIKNFCQTTGQSVPSSYREQARCIFDSLAMRYREVFEMLQSFSNIHIDRLHIIGGGTQNYLLNQFTANAINIPVYAGPVEATAIGNIMVQAKSNGLVGNLKEMRKVISQCVSPQCYLPKDTDIWDKAFCRYKLVTKK